MLTNSRPTDECLAEPCLVHPATSFGSRLPEDIQLLRRIGRGYRAEVYEARYRGQPIALKVYSRACQERCRRRVGVSAAQFECARNTEFYHRAELRPYVAKPVGTWLECDGWTECFAQELLTGTTLRNLIASTGTIPSALARSVCDLCHKAWAEGLYDLDLQFGNIAVIDRDGEWIPKLFDFNLIPRNLTFPRPLQFLASLTGNAFFTWRDRRWLRRISQASQAASLRWP